jgi:hypothetical protein
MIPPQQVHKCGHVQQCSQQAPIVRACSCNMRQPRPANYIIKDYNVSQHHIEICPHNSASAGAQMWAHTAVLNSSAVRERQSYEPVPVPCGSHALRLTVSKIVYMLQRIEVCPHNSASAGAQTWSRTAVHCTDWQSASKITRACSGVMRQPRLTTYNINDQAFVNNILKTARIIPPQQVHRCGHIQQCSPQAPLTRACSGIVQQPRLTT